MERKRPRIFNTILKKKNVEILTPFNFKTYYIAILVAEWGNR